ncbi:MAG: hypothetical protein ACO3O3_11750, partial [Ilumatobacteraceae bacterium]
MMTPTVTDGAAMIAAPAETPQASTAFSAWLNNAMQQHGGQTPALGAEADADINLEGDAAMAHEDELLAIIDQLNGMLSGNQVSATHIGSVASAVAATEADAEEAASDTQLDSDAVVAEVVSLDLDGEMAAGENGSSVNAELTMPRTPIATASASQSTPATAPQAVEVAAPSEAPQLGIA